MRKAVSMALGLLLFTAANAAAQDVPGSLVGRVPLTPLAAEITNETRTAGFGGVVFSQQARVTEVARLQRDVPVHISTPTGAIRQRLSEGALLYRVELNQAQPQHAFCSFEPTVVQRPAPRPSNILRFCLGDIDGDGDFDNLYVMSSLLGGRRVNGEWVQNLPALVYGGAMGDAGAIETPARYTVLTEHDAALVQLQILAMPSVSGTGFMLVTARENGGWTQLDSQQVEHGDEFPGTVDVYGARIEVLSRIERTITYRVLNGFPEGGTLRLAINPVPAIPVSRRD